MTIEELYTALEPIATKHHAGAIEQKGVNELAADVILCFFMAGLQDPAFLFNLSQAVGLYALSYREGMRAAQAAIAEKN